MSMAPVNVLFAHLWKFFGAPPLKRFGYITLPYLGRAITVVVLIQTIFLLAIFAEIYVTT